MRNNCNIVNVHNILVVVLMHWPISASFHTLHSCSCIVKMYRLWCWIQSQPSVYMGVPSLPPHCHPLLSFCFPPFPSPEAPPLNPARAEGTLWVPPAGSGGARPPARFMVYFELKITPLVTQNQQPTTYLCHNWNSELTLYANKQKFYGNYC